MSETQTYPNAGPNCDLSKYRTGETPMVGDVVQGHDQPIWDNDDQPPGFQSLQCGILSIHPDGTGLLQYDATPFYDEDTAEKYAEVPIYAFAARFDLISRAVVPLADSPDAEKMVAKSLSEFAASEPRPKPSIERVQRIVGSPTKCTTVGPAPESRFSKVSANAS